MRVALLTTFAASKKEPLAQMLGRVRLGFLDAFQAEPTIDFNFGDASVAGFVSSVDRVLKRHPELERFVTSADPAPGIRGARRISNGPLSAAAKEPLPYTMIEEIAAGVPRSFPFHSVVIHLHTPDFGEHFPAVLAIGGMLPGVLITDKWWVNGRQRSLSSCVMVEAEIAGKKLPPLPEAIAKVMASCGKAKRTIQAPLPAQVPTVPTVGVRLPNGFAVPSANNEVALAVNKVVQDYRGHFQEIVERAAMPHNLEFQSEAYRQETALGVTPGPMKPELDRVFKPLGYSCKGGHGSFTLRRRTQSNLTVELYMDVGTWGHAILPLYHVRGLGFKATLFPQIAPAAIPKAQHRIGDASRWTKIVENLGALVTELDRSFVPDVENAAGPSPDWYEPES